MSAEPNADIYQAPEIYDEQYLAYRDDVPHYQRLAHDSGGPVLELGAGTGRLSVALAAAGHRVVGVEQSSAMLERGRAHAESEGVADRVNLQQGDMRRLELNEKFPLIIAAFNTLMHLYTLPDQDAALTAAASHLAPGGTFAFDLFQPRFGPQGVVRREAEWGHVGGEHAELFLVQNHDPLAQIVESRYLLDLTGSDGVVRRRSTSLRQRYYHRFEIERALRQAGFRRVRLYGDFERTPLSDGSRHIVGIARL